MEQNKMDTNVAKKEPKYFDFGDVFFECNRCGNYQRLGKGIHGGMQFVLPTSDSHEWRLVCGKCENMMRIFFKESDEETKVQAREELRVKEEEQRKKAEEEALEKAKIESEKESKKKNKKKRSAKRSPKDNAGSDQFDGEGDAITPLTD